MSSMRQRFPCRNVAMQTHWVLCYWCALLSVTCVYTLHGAPYSLFWLHIELELVTVAIRRYAHFVASDCNSFSICWHDTPHDNVKSRIVVKDLSLKAKAKTKDHNCVLKDNQEPRPRTTSLLIGRSTDDSSVVWKYVRPVDRVRAAVAPGSGTADLHSAVSEVRTDPHIDGAIKAVKSSDCKVGSGGQQYQMRVIQRSWGGEGQNLTDSK